MSMVVQRILAMPDDDFRELVNRDLRQQVSTEEAQALRSPDVFERWHAMLVSMSKTVDGQLGTRREDFLATRAELRERMEAALAEHRKAESELNKLSQRYHQARAASLRFKSGLDAWLVEARTIRRMRQQKH